VTDFSPLDSALYESTPEKIAASLRYLRKADAVMAALMPLSASTQAPPADREETSAVKGDAIDAITLAKNEAYARGLKDGAKQAPPAAVALPDGMVMVQRADLAALEATDFGRCGWSVRADLAARRLRDGLLAAALAAREGE